MRKIILFLATSLLISWFYGWASPHAYPKETTLGFGYGALHGAMMPMALPSLLIGKEVEIYAVNNAGRLYKIGYITGINVCGLLLFGSVFWNPAKKTHLTKPGSG